MKALILAAFVLVLLNTARSPVQADNNIPAAGAAHPGTSFAPAISAG